MQITADNVAKQDLTPSSVFDPGGEMVTRVYVLFYVIRLLSFN